MRPKITYANVMATIAVLIALGGASYAATQLPKDSVGAKQLKKNAVTTAKVKKEAITAAKDKKGTLTGTQINVSTLGTVPSAQTANSATVASSLPPAEPWNEVGAPGEPDFISGWKNEDDPAVVTAAFYKEQLGIVQLRGLVTAPSDAQSSILSFPLAFGPKAAWISRSLDFAPPPRGVTPMWGGSRSRAATTARPRPSPEMSWDRRGTLCLSLSQVDFRAES